jgi:hypothetical protein
MNNLIHALPERPRRWIGGSAAIVATVIAAMLGVANAAAGVVKLLGQR